MASYTSQRTNLAELSREALNLYREWLGFVPEHVSNILANLRNLERLLEDHYAFALQDRDILDIGAGQFLIQMHYLARHNRVVGIDFDVIAQGLNPLQY